ncbi:MAG: arsenite methyltransferase [Bacillota bacterium]
MSEDMKREVRRRYGQLARAASSAGSPCADSCCSGTACCEETLEGLPPEMVQTSLGSGSPVDAAGLQPGHVVLDLGSGAGLDVLLAARRVGETGKVYGLDMTEEMLALAERHRQKSGADNVQFIRGEMEEIPLPDGSVDAVLSNCVVNLSPDKERVFAECHRVLRAGGKLAISDVVWRDEVPPGVRSDADLWCSCVGGALTERDYVDLLTRAGFTGVKLQRTGAWQANGGCCGAPSAGSGKLNSALVTARKPS